MVFVFFKMELIFAEIFFAGIFFVVICFCDLAKIFAKNLNVKTAKINSSCGYLLNSSRPENIMRDCVVRITTYPESGRDKIPRARMDIGTIGRIVFNFMVGFVEMFGSTRDTWAQRKKSRLASFKTCSIISRKTLTKPAIPTQRYLKASPENKTQFACTVKSAINPLFNKASERIFCLLFYLRLKQFRNDVLAYLPRTTDIRWVKSILFCGNMTGHVGFSASVWKN